MRKLSLLLFVLYILSGCALTTKVSSDFDKDVDFSQIKAYQLYNEGLTKLEVNTLDKRRLIKAVENELAKKGLSATGRPDILVNILVVTGEVNKTSAGYVGGGYVFDYTAGQYVWTSSTWSPNANIELKKETTIMIDLIDPVTKNLIWHGQSNGFKIDNYNNREESINKNISRILDQYPPMAR